MKIKSYQLAANIKNAQNAFKLTATVPATFANHVLLYKLHQAEFISGYQYSSDFTKIFVHLKYFNNSPVIKDIITFSKPSQRLYVNTDTLKRKFSKGSFVLLSTSKTYELPYLHYGIGNVKRFVSKRTGVLNLDEVKKLNIGGELLLQVIV